MPFSAELPQTKEDDDNYLIDPEGPGGNATEVVVDEPSGGDDTTLIEEAILEGYNDPKHEN